MLPKIIAQLSLNKIMELYCTFIHITVEMYSNVSILHVTILMHLTELY